ncbi:MAG: relaxase/mobilization nuclease domain-containing protein [Neglectibacter timonensis]
MDKGRHAFIVTTHTDKRHIHCHIYYNSTTLDCTRKFRNFWGSSFASGGSPTGCVLKTGCPSWRTRSPEQG